jgi:hypothetical protein
MFYQVLNLNHVYGYYLGLFWRIANSGVRAHQRFSVYYRFIVCSTIFRLHTTKVCTNFSNLYGSAASSTEVSISHVESFVSVVVGNSRITSSVSFLWPDHEDSAILSSCTVLPLTLLQKTVSSKFPHSVAKHFASA